ncbi:hypothetical protein [Clostridium oryzae]|uniref:Uncharacterized protein n=1 Tax=Clostridium oryzae TaxID=1450648 RepID=A0A1V4IIF0_9CLOT|nr:hypothetical protein [Clostridium oryzae]OPJ59782.1 hypothetical protein CLORY_31270 [Clostridium oryzae]
MSTDKIFQYGSFLKIYTEEDSIIVNVNMEGLDKETINDIEMLINSALSLLQEKSIAEVLYSQNKEHIAIRIAQSKYLM